MINLGRLSGATFAAALLLCAFPGATGGQEKTVPSILAIALDLEKLRTEFDSSKKNLEERLDRLERRLDRIESSLKYPQRSDCNAPECGMLPRRCRC
jgi:hypothetical protein